MVYSHTASLPLIYVFSAVSGMIFAFSMPAGNSILPRLVPGEHLLAANGLIMAGNQLGLVLGPVITGILIFLFGGESYLDTKAISICFALDGVSFSVALTALYFIKFRDSTTSLSNREHTSYLSEFKEGFLYLLSDRSLSIFMIYMATINVLVVGPLMVGLPVFVDKHLHAGGDSYGFLASFYGLGALIGAIFPNMIRPSPKFLGLTVLCLDAVVALLLAVFSQTTSMFTSCASLGVMGIFSGYIMTTVFSWIQMRVHPYFLGRVIAFVLFATVGLIPVSSALAGFALSKWAPSELFLWSAMAMLSIACACVFLSDGIRSMGYNTLT